MKKLEVGGEYVIHCYKHNGSIHKVWEEAVLLDVKEDCLVFGNDKTKVIESDGRSWKTREPAIMYFFKDKWFNVIGQYKKDGIQFYCNIASPYLIELNAVKYIDYDLDVRVFPDGSFRVLDRGEYNYHKHQLKYPKELDDIVKKELTVLIDSIRNKDFPFDPQEVRRYYDIYRNLTPQITYLKESA